MTSITKKTLRADEPPRTARAPLAPQRAVGRERVAALLSAAAKVIQHRGFDAATMAEIASSADTKVGSLYRFFPNKESVGEALLQRYSALRDAQCDEIDQLAAVAPLDTLADRMINAFIDIYDDTKACMALLDARTQWSDMRSAFREQNLQRIAQTLRICAPALSETMAGDIAVVVLNNMKTMVAMVKDGDVPTSPGGIAELRLMNRLYLQAKLAGLRHSGAALLLSPGAGDDKRLVP